MNKANIIVEGKISKILNKKNLFRLPDKVLKNNRCQKFVNEQSTIFLQ